MKMSASRRRVDAMIFDGWACIPMRVWQENLTIEGARRLSCLWVTDDLGNRYWDTLFIFVSFKRVVLSESS